VYGGDTADYSVQSSVVSAGSYALEATTNSNSGAVQLATTAGLDAYPQAGDTFSIDVRLTATEQVLQVYSLSQGDDFLDRNARLIVRSDLNRIQIGENDTDVDISSHLNEWLTVTVKIGLDGSLDMTLADSSDTVLGTVSGQTELRSGGIIYRFFTGNSETESGYFDNLTVKRREPEARANTAKGVTELGNEVVPSGAIQTGPMEVPADHPNYPMVNLPVTDDLAQGTQVGYHLAINQDKALTIEAEADGAGGIQNAHVSFENTQIADPANTTSADSMTADPESASEDGFVEVDIDGTTYQVPMYQA